MTAPVDGMTAEARDAVDELLALRGQPITLIPGTGTVVEKPGGGKDYEDGAPRAVQLFAKFNTARLEAIATDGGTQSDRGTARKFEFRMIGAHDAVVQVGDHWEDYAATYTVESVDDTQPYQITAVVHAFLKIGGGTTVPYERDAMPFVLPVTLED